MSGLNKSTVPDRDATLHYHWNYSPAYYSTLVDRYYKQLPYILHLPVQYALLWLVGTTVLFVNTSNPSLVFAGQALLIGALGIPALVFLTKRGIVLKYRLRSIVRGTDYGVDADYFASEAGITIRQKLLNSSYPWTTYSRAVRFSDGILLLKPGAIRWLPDYALQRGTVDEAMVLVRSRLPTRLMSK